MTTYSGAITAHRDEAQQIFDKMPVRDTVSGTANFIRVRGCTANGGRHVRFEGNSREEP